MERRSFLKGLLATPILASNVKAEVEEEEGYMPYIDYGNVGLQKVVVNIPEYYRGTQDITITARHVQWNWDKQKLEWNIFKITGFVVHPNTVLNHYNVIPVNEKSQVRVQFRELDTGWVKGQWAYEEFKDIILDYEIPFDINKDNLGSK
jgi:hypothetical protein